MFEAFDVITIGDVMIDVFMELEKQEAMVRHNLEKNHTKICFNYADKIPVESMQKMMAGNACNVAVASRRMGLRTAYVTIVGKDYEAKMVMQGLMKEKIDTRFIKQDKRTNLSVVINYQGERTIFVYHEPRDYHLPRLSKAKFFYLTSLRPGWEVMIKPLCEYLDRTGTKLAYNPGTYQLRAGVKLSQPLLDRTEVIFLNKDEAALYVNKSADTSLSELATAVHRHGPRIVVITDGPNGSFVSDGTAQYKLGIFDVPAVERTGCGDAFASGFMIALIQGKDVPTAMRWGSFESASVLQQVGPQAGLLTKKEMDLYERKYPDFTAKEAARYQK